MSQETFRVTINFNRVELDAWIDKKPSPRGGYDLIGMGRRTEYDHKTGAVVSEKVEPTGVVGWAPSEFFDGPKKSWRRRLLGDA